MLPENAIEVRNVTKKFKVYFDKGYQLKEKVLFSRRNRFEERCVLQDISFEVRKGEAVGLVGNNGCGKSTTLKLLSKIIYPDHGTIDLTGRVSSLIELGAGFHPDMSGRENIYTNAAIFGLNRKEIDERIDEIIEFSELGEYIDNPVRTYSSGMYMRLAFSVAINVDAELLLIDEILAVGDAHFQAKCFNRLREIKASGTTIVIVSHSTSQIEQICDKAIWIKNGQIEQTGFPRDVIQVYMSWVMGRENGKIAKASDTEKARMKKNSMESRVEEESFIYTAQDIIELKKSGKLVEVGNRELEITDYELLDAKTGKHKAQFGIGESILLRVFYERNNADIKETMFSLAIYRNDGLNCYSTNCFINTGENVVLKDEGILEITIKNNPFMQGEYKLDISLNKDYGPTYHGYLNACTFEIYNITTDYGVCRPDIIWNLDVNAKIDTEWLGSDLKSLQQYMEEKEILKINLLSMQTLTIPLSREYDLIIIEDSVFSFGSVENIIRGVIEHTKYLLIQDEMMHYFEKKIVNSKIFEKNGSKEMLIFMSTKNKILISDIADEIQKEEGEIKWLLDCFKEGKLSFKIIVEQMNCFSEDDFLTVCLENKTDHIITLLDEDIAFSYRYFSEQNMQEGIRSMIRHKVYPGTNWYKLDVAVAKGGKIFISIVKEKEYWLNHILPECVEEIEV